VNDLGLRSTVDKGHYFRRHDRLAWVWRFQPGGSLTNFSFMTDS